MLTLPEEFFLLTIDDDKGKLVASAATILRYGLAGALLAELTLSHKLRLDEESKLIVTDTVPGQDAVLDETLAKMTASSKAHKVRYWVHCLTVDLKPFIRQLAGGLQIRGVLTVEQKHYLWVIPYAVYPQQDASAKYWVKQRLRSAVLTGEKPEARTLVLLSLVSACGMLNLVFTKDERRAAARQIRALVQGEIFGQEVSNVLKEIEAVTAAVAAATAS